MQLIDFVPAGTLENLLTLLRKVPVFHRPCRDEISFWIGLPGTLSMANFRGASGTGISRDLRGARLIVPKGHGSTDSWQQR